MTKKVLLITNIPSPYNVDLFYYLQTHVKEYEFWVLYTSRAENNRQWHVNEKKIVNSFFATSLVLRIRTKLDYRYIHITRGIEKILNQITADVIVSWEYNLTSIRAMMWCKSKKKTYISVTEGTLLTEQRLSFIQKKARQYICKNADAFLVSGIKAEEKVLSWGVEKRKVFTELLTVDISKFKNSNRNLNENIILYVGSTAKRKGLDLLIRALPKVKSSYKLRIVGSGNQKEIHELKMLAETEKVNSKIAWCGFKEGKDLVEEYQQATVFVLPSREDCFGLVLVEALASGVPIIASKFADGAYDTVEEGKNGWIIDPYNCDEFAFVIDRILNDIYFQKKCYLSSKKLVQKFEYENVAKGFVNALNFVNVHLKGE